MKTQMMLSLLLTSPIYFYFHGTMREWGIYAISLFIFLLVVRGVVKVKRRRMMRVMDQHQPGLPRHREYRERGDWSYNQPNYLPQYQQPPPVYILPQGGMQAPNQAPEPVYHDLPLERYELL